jgi:hypothetical protein
MKFMFPTKDTTFFINRYHVMMYQVCPCLDPVPCAGNVREGIYLPSSKVSVVS